MDTPRPRAARAGRDRRRAPAARTRAAAPAATPHTFTRQGRTVPKAKPRTPPVWQATADGAASTARRSAAPHRDCRPLPPAPGGRHAADVRPGTIIGATTPPPFVGMGLPRDREHLSRNGYSTSHRITLPCLALPYITLPSLTFKVQNTTATCQVLFWVLAKCVLSVRYGVYKSFRGTNGVPRKGVGASVNVGV